MGFHERLRSHADKLLDDLKKIAGAFPAGSLTLEKFHILKSYIEEIVSIEMKPFLKGGFRETLRDLTLEKRVFDPRVDVSHKKFFKGGYYYSKNGVFKVVGSNGLYPIIFPKGMHDRCYSQSCVDHMWREHFLLLNKIKSGDFLDNEFCVNYEVPEISPHDLILKIKDQYEAEIKEAYDLRQQSLGIKFGGIRRNELPSYRSPNCWSCGDHLDSYCNFSCRACGWLICECGACGCGYPGPRE